MSNWHRQHNRPSPERTAVLERMVAQHTEARRECMRLMREARRKGLYDASCEYRDMARSRNMLARLALVELRK